MLNKGHEGQRSQRSKITQRTHFVSMLHNSTVCKYIPNVCSPFFSPFFFQIPVRPVDVSTLLPSKHLKGGLEAQPSPEVTGLHRILSNSIKKYDERLWNLPKAQDSSAKQYFWETEVPNVDKQCCNTIIHDTTFQMVRQLPSRLHEKMMSKPEEMA